MSTNEATVKPIEPIELPASDSADGKREKSGIEFPYLDLDAAIEVTKGVHAVAGSSCAWDQLAARLNQSATSGGFRMKVMTGRTFGLLTYANGIVTLTDLGRRLCDGEQEKAAKADAFLEVPLYKAISELYKNGSLPPADALEKEIAKLGVPTKQTAKARQAFQRSANSAGFFWSGPNRLVYPPIKASAASTPAPLHPRETEKKKEDEGDEKPRHPLIEGLLKELPKPQQEWTTEDRKKWLEMASTIFNVIYKDSDDSRGSLRVVVEKNSAKP
jgi:hypothetical protein